MYFTKKFYYLTIYLNEHSCVWVFADEMTRSQNSLHFFRSNENNNSLNHRKTMKKKIHTKFFNKQEI